MSNLDNASQVQIAASQPCSIHKSEARNQSFTFNQFPESVRFLLTAYACVTSSFGVPLRYSYKLVSECEMCRLLIDFHISTDKVA